MLILAAQRLAYQSCSVIGLDNDEVAKLINESDAQVIGSTIAIGKGTQDAWPKSGQLMLNEVVIVVV